MGNLVLVANTCGDRRSVSKRNFFCNFIRWLRCVLAWKTIDADIRLVELSDGTAICLIVLPYCDSELSDFGRIRLSYICRFISNVCNEYGIGSCVFPKKLAGIPGFGIIEKKVFSGHFLFKSLITNILDEIYSNRGLDIGSLDITIIGGENRNELITYVKLISPMVKFLSIVADDKEGVEKDLEEIYADTGLAVRITNDLASSVKNADFIVNLRDIGGDNAGFRLKAGAIMLNYGKFAPAAVSGEYTLINGIEVRLPKKIILNIGNGIAECFEKSELAEAILFHKLGIEEKAEDIFEDYRLMEQVSSGFRKGGYAIAGFIGRHNVIRAEDIYKKPAYG